MTETIIRELKQRARVLTVVLEHRDLHTSLHSDRVCGLSMSLGRACGLCEDEVRAIGIGATFHDVGKVGVPDSVLLKPARLEQEDWVCMKKHPIIGANIMLALETPGAEFAAVLVRHHHEYFNGQGYPDHLEGESIPVGSRIISIADSYDAMSETRAYHRARSHDQIIDIIESEMGSKLDPSLVALFKRHIETSEFRVH